MSELKSYMAHELLYYGQTEVVYIAEDVDTRIEELEAKVQELEEALIDAFKIDSYDPVSHEQFIEKYESLFKLAKLRETNDEASSL